jgi:hypothetical protein
MRIIGLITVVIVAAVLLGGILLILRSLPDIRRYLRIRSM